MVVAFAQALREAEAARAVAASTKSPTTMAADAYENLCFDFPLVDKDALDALGLVIKSNLAVTGRISFPITPRFVAGLSHLARPAAPSQLGEDANTPGNDSQGQAKGPVSDQSIALATILSCVLVVSPSHALATALTDDGGALRALLGTYRSAGPTAGVPQELASETLTQSNEAAIDEGHDQPDPLPEDDDSDWEPLEEGLSGAKPPYPDPLLPPPDDGRALTWQELIGRLADLASHTRYEALICSAVWADPTLRLVPSILDLLAGLQACGRHHAVDVTAATRPYLALLVDRLAADSANGGSDSIATVVPRVLTTLTSSQPGDPSLAPAFLSSLVARLAARPTAHPLLWPAVQEALPMLAAHAQTVLGTKTERGHDWLAEVEAVMIVLTFYVEAAPGNADIGPPLLQSGLLRDSLALFAAAAAAPPAEQLRRFLLFACAASPVVARFAAAVPTFLATTTSEAFLDARGPASLHAAIWPLVLPRAATSLAGAEDRAAALVREPAQAWTGGEDPDAIMLAGALGRLHRFLSLLQSVVRAAPANRAVWTKGGPLEHALKECAASLRSAKTSTAQSSPPQSAALREFSDEATSPDEGTIEAVGSAQLTALRESVKEAPSSNEPDDRRTDATVIESTIESRIQEAALGIGGERHAEEGKPAQIEEVTPDLDGEVRTKGGSRHVRSADRQAPEVDRSTAEDKVQELLPTVLKQLKEISDHSRGAGAVGKND
ncbi:hypothetical protein KFL_002980110 [Klebsormidium nitens]|uniref:Uncharacterized protein n=1 Tax=Klebsormidium nitens TaxID=105231 RepID=A0A1Y1IEP7_KLENI|nr:hypothetical protein KFL_002980110 [Klebsormidium nitens]|eukprot:GAQ86588.1 hypothetical protein KFL_002980110 [Klebsormidium nitens]